MKPGYKQTDVGVIPEDWGVHQVGELNPFVTSGSRGWAAFYSDTGSLFVRITNMSRESIFLDLENSKFVSLPRDDNEGARTQLQEHDVLVSITADIGIVAYVDSSVPIPAYINQHISLVRFDEEKANSKFISYFLASEIPQKLFRASTDVGAKAGMSLLTVRKLEFASPPLPEQRAIAEALSDVDALLDSLDRLIAKKRDLKQAAMQQLLTGQTRLPGFDGEWEMKRLGDVAQVIKGQLITEGTVIRGSIPVIAGGKKPAYFHNCSNRSGKTITISTSGASAGYVAFFEEPIFASDCSTVSEGPGYVIEFIYFLFKLNQEIIYKAQTGGAQPHIHANDLMPLEFYWPPIPEQTAIAEVLTDMDAEREALEQRREKTRGIKQGMMQELLTGRTRLVAADAKVIPFPKKAKSKETKHNWAINEAVVISVLAKQFGSEEYPLGRKRYTKFSYLLHRHCEKRAEGYLKKAAGPYNPSTKYKGPENIAVKNSYVKRHQRDKFKGFIAAEKVDEAEAYFSKWYGPDALTWLEQFRKKKNDELELLATVDMAMDDLSRSRARVDVNAVKSVLGNHPEWVAKLNRDTFSDEKISGAITQCQRLFEY